MRELGEELQLNRAKLDKVGREKEREEKRERVRAA